MISTRSKYGALTRLGGIPIGWIMVAALFAATTAFAQSGDYSATQQGIDNSGFQQLAIPGGPLSFGDPISYGGLIGQYSHVDLTIATSLGPFELKTNFEMDPYIAAETCAAQDALPRDGVFTSVSQHGAICTGHANQHALWTTNLYSYVTFQEMENDTGILVRLPSGEQVLFDGNGCGVGQTCSAADSQNSLDLLYQHALADGGTEYIVDEPGVGRYYFEPITDTQTGFTGYPLSRVEGLQYGPIPSTPRPLYTIHYATTDTGGACSSGTITNLDCPYTQMLLPRTVVTADGEEVRFHYSCSDVLGAGRSCALSAVGLAAKGAADESVTNAVQYTHQNGLVTSIQEANGVTTSFELISSGGKASEFDVFGKNNVLVAKKVFASGVGKGIARDWVQVRPEFTVSGTGNEGFFDAGTCTSLVSAPFDPNALIPLPSGRVCEDQSYSVTFPRSGDGTGTPAMITTTANVADPEPEYFTGTIVQQLTTTCSGSCGGMPETRSQIFPWTYVGDRSTGRARRSAYATQDLRGYFTVFDAGVAVFPNLDGGFPQFQKQLVRYGATSKSGSDAITYQSFSYADLNPGVTPAFHDQLLTEVRAPGAMQPEQVTIHTYDSSGRLTTTKILGETVVFSPGSDSFSPNVVKTIRTDIQDSRSESYDAGTPANQGVVIGTGEDPLGRTLESVGPYFTDEDANDAPRVQYFYYSPDAGLNSNKLAAETKIVFANGSVTAFLTTTYDEYDAWGHVVRSTDPNNVVTANAYNDGGQLASSERSADGVFLTTAYQYDEEGHLTAVRDPAGVWTVSCYRFGSIGPNCTGGTMSSQVQWKATMGGATGPDPASATEEVDYTYDGSSQAGAAGSGRLIGEDYYAISGQSRTLRRSVRHEASPSGEPTYEQAGNGTPGSYAVAAQFDPVGNRTAQGFAYNFENSLPGDSAFIPFCSTTTSGEAATSSKCAQMGYDALSRLKELIPASPDGGASATPTDIAYDPAGNVSSIQTNGTKVSYGYDDFHNLVSVEAPWLASPSGTSPGVVHYAYNAEGKIRYKQTPEMAAHSQYVEYSYDSMGRELKAQLHEASGDSVLLYSYEYDGSVERPARFTTANDHTLGRVARRDDSFGTTWYSYDAFGHITHLFRCRDEPDGGDCDTADDPESNLGDKSPSSAYDYDTVGRLTSERYPHGRTVYYEYGGGGDAEKVVTISASLDAPDGGTPAADASTELISSIEYEPYGAVRSYRILPPDEPSLSMPVEYLAGENSSAVPNVTCSSGKPSGSGDYTGRLRALWVSSDAGSSGDVFKRWYTYSGAQVSEEETCFLDTSADVPRTVVYSSAGSASTHDGYDGQLRLTNVSRPAGQFSALGGTVGRRQFSYDARGNRLTETDDCWKFQETYDSADRLFSRVSVDGDNCQASPKSSVTYGYDNDGRVLSMFWGPWQGGSHRNIYFDQDPDFGNGLDGVYQEVTVDGVSYRYLYDALGRRREKDYAAGGTNEFFYDDSRMIEDRDAFVGGTGAPTAASDEYIWLAGRPVVMIRTLVVNDPAAGAEDGLGSGEECDRGDGVACGVYFLVNDALGKPVLMIDSAGKAAGEAEYTPFGLPNRVTFIADSPHPYANTGSSDLYASLREPVHTGEVVRGRVRLTDLETSGINDYVFLSSGAQVPGAGDVDMLGSRIYGSVGSSLPSDGGIPDGGLGDGLPGAPVISDWVDFSSTGLLQVRFKASQANGANGVTVAGFDYQRFQFGAKTAWTHLGFPGQYYDPETDLFENWHRYYDANTGRYLEPDPVWKYPETLVPRLASGHFDPVYAYGGDNPIGASDPRGALPIAVTSGALNGDVNKLIDAAYADSSNPLHDEVVSILMSDSQLTIHGDTSDLGASAGGAGFLGQTRPTDNGAEITFDNRVTIDHSKGETAYTPMFTEGDQLGNQMRASFSVLFAHEMGHAESYLMGVGQWNEQFSNTRAVQYDNAERSREGLPLLDEYYGHPFAYAPTGGPVPASDPTSFPAVLQETPR